MVVKKISVPTAATAALMALAMGTGGSQIAQWEGTKYEAYRDIVGVLTVCTGHTGPDIVVGKVYTPEECKALSVKDAMAAGKGVLAISPQLLFHPMQFASAISFSYNVGTGTYGKSSVARNFNEGNFIGACNALLKYTYAGGKYVPGLANRRAEERKICMSTLTVEGMKDVGITPKAAD